jgi:D-arabinose 1-dehydrogenase-like Zn-dependent alcohol dehydrogenase
METMKALIFREFGAADRFELAEFPRPQPGPGEVLVRIAAAGVCYHDLLMRAGLIPAETGQIVGHEIAGEIVAAGGRAEEARIGERVTLYQRLFCGQCRACLSGRQDLCRTAGIIGERGVAGGYAEYIAVPSINAVRIPDGVDFAAASLASCPIGTGIRALLGVAGAGPGDTILVTGAGGGLGLHQIQLAKSVSARVLAVTGSDAKIAAIRAAGADEIVVSPDSGFSREVWRLTDKQGVDIVLENVVTGTFDDSMRSLAPHGHIVVLGNVGVQPVTANPGLVIARRARISGSGSATLPDLHRALAMMKTGAIRPVIGATLPFVQAADAHLLMEARRSIGRVVLSGW